MNPLLEQVIGVWFSLKEKATVCCSQLFGEHGETHHFNDRSGARGEHEMSSFRSTENQEIRMRGQSEYDELGKYGHAKENGTVEPSDTGFNEFGGDPNNRISALQAGWNVTNAIQVIG